MKLLALYTHALIKLPICLFPTYLRYQLVKLPYIQIYKEELNTRSAATCRVVVQIVSSYVVSHTAIATGSSYLVRKYLIRYMAKKEQGEEEHAHAASKHACTPELREIELKYIEQKLGRAREAGLVHYTGCMDVCGSLYDKIALFSEQKSCSLF